MDEIQRESYKIELTIECFNDDEVNEITDGFIDHLEKLDHTHWSMSVNRDLETEEALKHFRQNKEESLAALPDELVMEYLDNGGTLPNKMEWSPKKKRHLTVVPDLDHDDLGA